MENLSWDLRFLDLAKLVSTWSQDPSTKVGAVIADSDNRIVSIGYNGFPKGIKDFILMKIISISSFICLAAIDLILSFLDQ